ncbi:hypothetical protein HYQ46_001969 [Verticillium longisporum]|nr:hypothetical protein HYQ46_001969 [Verticillium longisporum]
MWRRSSKTNDKTCARKQRRIEKGRDKYRSASLWPWQVDGEQKGAEAEVELCHHEGISGTGAQKGSAEPGPSRLCCIPSRTPVGCPCTGPWDSRPGDIHSSPS